ncbi:hypothetical protein [Allomuricauda sp. d1]|uniref:hypothetical protein n=1 Tax=Allomuricauda sp. d1 TaxID=3136725 RepID=UPI0031DF94C3
MMSSPAIHYNGKVFAFFSTKQKMVFKFGKDYPLETLSVELQEFSPFKTKRPLSGWYEASFTNKKDWETLAELSLKLAKQN